MIYGLGFANAMLDMGLTIQSDWLELVAYNAGLESAQILVVLLLILGLASNKESIKYEMIEVKGSIAVVIFGFILFLMRL